MTMKDMCEVIEKSGILNTDDKKPTAREIFEYSSTGELSMVFVWYEVAKQLTTQSA
jgi:hypothetical protein